MSRFQFSSTNSKAICALRRFTLCRSIGMALKTSTVRNARPDSMKKLSIAAATTRRRRILPGSAAITSGVSILRSERNGVEDEHGAKRATRLHEEVVHRRGDDEASTNLAR